MKKFGVFLIFSIIAVALIFSLTYTRSLAKAVEYLEGQGRIWVDGGTYILEDGYIGTYSYENGGRICVVVTNGGTFEMRGGDIGSETEPTVCDALLYVDNGTINFLGGRIIDLTGNFGNSVVWLECAQEGKIKAVFNGSILCYNTSNYPGIQIDLNNQNKDNYDILFNGLIVRGEGYGINIVSSSDTGKSNSKFRMDDGIISDGKYGLHLDGQATFVMAGGTIENNDIGAAIALNCSFEMSGGQIINCKVDSGITTGSTTVESIILSGDAKISGNAADGIHGVCRIFQMSDNVEISDNEGYGIYFTPTSNSADFVCEINGGSIKNNKKGGINYILRDNPLIINDCDISGNAGIGALYMYGSLTMNGGRIHDNNSSSDVSVSVKDILLYNGGIIEDTIQAGTIILSKEPESVLNIKANATTAGTQIAKLKGISTIDLTKIKVTNSRYTLTYKTISGEKWIVLGSTISTFTTDEIIKVFSNPWKVEAEEEFDFNFELETKNIEPNASPIMYVENKKQKPNFAAIYDNKKFYYLEPVKDDNMA